VSPEDLVLTPGGLRFRGRRIACSVGRSGIVPADAKREGDGATPGGVHRIDGCFYRADRIARPVPWAVEIGPGDLWSDDPGAADYNRWVRAPYAGSHERLRRGDGLYDLILNTDWNRDGLPWRGSAIFLHRWRRPGFPTAGCVAMAADDLLWITQRLAPGTRLVVPVSGAPGLG
jgi:L,D-peptidoglycan transpeptidase YkuD (ErfK/YbiS/YcfS/YnhG family)